ncbi:MAG: heavy metal translocating P-type ATPase [Dorea sp.]
MKAKLKKRSIIYCIGVVVYICAMYAMFNYTLSKEIRFVLFMTAYLIIGFEAFKNLRNKILEKKFFSEYTMIVLATMGAIGIERYAEGVLVMILFELGMIFEAVSSSSAKKSIEEMIDIRPEYATKKFGEDELQVDPSELEKGDIIIIKPGERIPVDAVILSGTTLIDTKAVTGESAPVSAGPKDKIYSGCINLYGAIKAKVLKKYEDSTVSQIMQMIEDAQNRKAESEAFIARFSKIYTPVMLAAALFVMVYPPMTFSFGNWDTWIYRGLIFLVVACPSGLVVSIPIAFLGGIASAARHGVLIKGGNYLENLANADTFVFDKTGTLTEGVFSVQEVKAVGMSEEELLKIAAHVESYSNHPIAQSLVSAYPGEVDKRKIYRVKETPGYGISAIYENERVYVGNWRLMDRQEVLVDEVDAVGTVIYVCIGKRYAGYILIGDTIKEDAKWTLQYLKDKYRAILVMLTGDVESAGRQVAKELQMDYAYTNLMPKDKLEKLEEFLFLQDSTEKVVCVGDGVNDAPILARADVGVAMGALGSAAAIEAADVVLMEDELPKIIDAIKIAKETLKVVKQNIVFALFVKSLILVFASIGYFGMWEAIVVEVGVMFTAILNAVWVVKYNV